MSRLWPAKVGKMLTAASMMLSAAGCQDDGPPAALQADAARPAGPPSAAALTVPHTSGPASTATDAPAEAASPTSTRPVFDNVAH